MSGKLKDYFSFHLNKFENGIQECWRDLQNEKDFCDLTLACEDKQIQVHRIVVSFCSPILRNILKVNQSSNQVIYLRRIKYRDLKSLVTFMYHGEVNILEEDLSNFLEVANDLQIEGLSQKNIENCKINELESLKVDSQKICPNKVENRVSEETNYDLLEGSDLLSPNIYKNLLTKSKEIVGPKDTEGTDSLMHIERNDSGLKHVNPDLMSKVEEIEETKQVVVPTSQVKVQICIECQKQYSTKAGLSQHNKAVHLGVRYSCDKCDYKTGSNSHFHEHVRTIHEGLRFYCELCDYKSISRNGLKYHKKSIHEEVRFPCDSCTFKATEKKSLQTHVKVVHEGFRYSCDKCDYNVSQKIDLKIHKKSFHK